MVLSPVESIVMSGIVSRPRLAGLLSGAALLFGSVAIAQVQTPVYKWADAQGHVHYTDLPPPSDAKLLAVERATSSVSGTTRSAVATPSAPGARTDAGARPKAASERDAGKANPEQCKLAQERYQNDLRSRRLYRIGDNNERVYLTDAEMDTERAEAKHDVELYCGSAD
jgi:hypothetical protein